MFGTRKLGKTSTQRKALLRQQVTDLLENGKMETTFYRAKEVQPVVEKMITLGKKGDLAAYRKALSFITKEDVDKATGVVGQRSEAGMDNSLTYCYSVEGGAEIAKEITRGVVPVIGSIYVEQYLGDFTPFGPAVTQALKSTDGVMIFDIVHLNKHKLWEELEAAMKAAEE